MFFPKSSTEKSQLGIYWGKDAFCFVESKKGQPDKIAYVNFDTPIAGDQGQKIPEGLRLTALIQQVIREKKFTCKKVNLSLSVKDVIYRSFVIPFMQPAEVKSVVDFEATKYIPIKLEDLAYTFHAIPFSEGDQKSLRILFVATRKNIVERYTSILQQSGLETEFIEPASVSLVRILQKQGHIPKQQATGIIEIENEGGRITVTDKDVIQFVREFQSSIEGTGLPAENAKFFNDIHVAFNFYQRQNPQGKLDRIITLSTNDLSPLTAGLSQEFKIPATSLTVAKILKTEQISDSGMLSAAGAAIREKASASKNFDLTTKIKTNKPGLESTSVLANWNLKLVGICVGASIALVYLTWLWSTSSIADAKKRSANLSKKLGIYESSPKEKITELKDGVVSKLNQYQDVRTKSDITYYLRKIPQMLPSGAWLNNLNIEYYEGAETNDGILRRVANVALSMDGYVYLPTSNEQLRQINTMVAKMKNDKELAKLFKEIVLANVKQDNYNNYTVTNFRIGCK